MFLPSTADSLLYTAMWPKTSTIICAALAVNLILLIVIASEKAKINSFDVGGINMSVHARLYSNRVYGKFVDGIEIETSTTYLCDPEDVFEPACPISKRVQGFQIAAVVFNAVLILTGLFFINYCEPNVYWYSFFILLMVGLFISTCGLIANQVQLVDFVTNTIQSETDVIRLESNYDVSFYFSNVCLVLELLICAICISKWRKDKMAGTYDNLTTAL
jgi:hypothetical protein